MIELTFSFYFYARVSFRRHEPGYSFSSSSRFITSSHSRPFERDKERQRGTKRERKRERMSISIILYITIHVSVMAKIMLGLRKNGSSFDAGP